MIHTDVEHVKNELKGKIFISYFQINNWKLEIIQSDFLGNAQLLTNVVTKVENMQKEMNGILAFITYLCEQSLMQLKF